MHKINTKKNIKHKSQDNKTFRSDCVKYGVISSLDSSIFNQIYFLLLFVSWKSQLNLSDSIRGAHSIRSLLSGSCLNQSNNNNLTKEKSYVKIATKIEQINLLSASDQCCTKTFFISGIFFFFLARFPVQISWALSFWP